MSTHIDRPVRPGSRPDTGAPRGDSDGSHRITPAPGGPRRRKTPLAWLPWAALGAIAAILLLSLLVINAVDDDGPDGPAGDTLGQAEASDGSGINGQDGDGRVTADGSDAAADQAAAGLKAGDQDLVKAAAGGSLAGAVGQPVTGTARVESVVSDEGFWVGSSPTERVFVFLTPQARQSTGESGFQVEAGQTVQLQGATVAIADLPDAIAGVDEDEGLAQLREQGALVRADRVALAG